MCVCLQVVPALSTLRQLRAVCFIWVDEDVALPSNLPWLAGLERLSIPSGLLLRSQEALAAARRLERLQVDMEEGSHIDAMLSWEAKQPPFRCLHLSIRRLTFKLERNRVQALPATVDAQDHTYNLHLFRDDSNLPPGFVMCRQLESLS
jgi:hypothetical protein